MIFSMPSEVPFIIALVVVPIVLLALALRFWKTLLKKNTAAETEPELDRPFRIGFAAEKGYSYRVMLYFLIEYEGTEDSYAVWADYTVEQSGSVVQDESAGAGNLLPADARRVNTHYFTSLTATLGRNRYRCTLQLFRTDKCEFPQEIRITGTVHAGSSTVVRELKVMATR
ncbi:MAG: hypothetical protein GF388_01695 [Candidatus Aegiribacteria sp.]|nr:hypothetical protein [Candidatus Aegiribacteria sp.]MBD3294087.1 hypothetical protein [Candidatus Fermentibacteria bacterium]